MTPSRSKKVKCDREPATPVGLSRQRAQASGELLALAVAGDEDVDLANGRG